MSNTRERVMKVVAAQFCTADEPLTDDTTFEQLGADSLDSVELGMNLEEEFGIHVDDETIIAAKTVGDAVRAVEERLGE